MTDASAHILSAAIKDFTAEEADPALIEDLQDRIDIVRHKLKFIENKPEVVCISALEPLAMPGNLVPQLVDVAGGIIFRLEIQSDFLPFDWDDIRLANPQIIILMLKDHTIERTMTGINRLLVLPGFDELTAVKNNRLYITDGSKYFYRSGPVIVDSLEILAEIINPKQFIFGYEGEAWIKFEI